MKFEMHNEDTAFLLTAGAELWNNIIQALIQTQSSFIFIVFVCFVFLVVFINYPCQPSVTKWWKHIMNNLQISLQIISQVPKILIQDNLRDRTNQNGYKYFVCLVYCVWEACMWNTRPSLKNKNKQTIKHVSHPILLPFLTIL